jgi:hypothetical protein
MNKVFLLKRIAVLFAILFSVSFISCNNNNNDDPTIVASSVTVEPATLTLSVGEKQTLTANVLPADATEKTVVWISSNEAIATVDVVTGEVTAVAEGTATIIATTTNGKTATCALTVTNVYVPDNNDVYVAGGEYGAALWKNGTAQTLDRTDYYMDEAYSVYVSGNDVYVAGYTFSPGEAILWKNGTAQSLNNGHVAYSVYVSGNDVYVAGDGYYETNYVAKLWKNGTEQSLSGSTNTTKARSVFVSGNDVYVAGSEYTGYGSYDPDYKSTAKLWKNGIAQSLSNGTNNAEAYSVYVSGNDVYVAGNQESGKGRKVATLWKNGVAQSLSGSTSYAEAYSVFVSGNDVYVAGYEEKETGVIATLWKNGTAQSLSHSTNYAEARSVYVLSSNVYVAGYEYTDNGLHGFAKLWKNGVAQSLNDYHVSSSDAYANSVFVVAK